MLGWKKGFWRYLLLFLTGYCVYLAIEVTFRGYSFRLMGLTGGTAMIILGFLLRHGMQKLQLPVQMMIGAAVITGLELTAGLFSLDVRGIRMWDYRDEWMSACENLICPRFSLYWYFLSGAAIFFTDAADYYLLGIRKRPVYRVFFLRFSFPKLRRMYQESSAESKAAGASDRVRTGGSYGGSPYRNSGK